MQPLILVFIDGVVLIRAPFTLAHVTSAPTRAASLAFHPCSHCARRAPYPRASSVPSTAPTVSTSTRCADGGCRQRYVLEAPAIRCRYPEYELISPPEIRHVDYRGSGQFNPFRSSTTP